MKKTITTVLLLLAALTLAQAADFNGDGYPDYVLYNPSTRQTAIWYLNNNVFAHAAYAPTLPAGWNLIAEADFNGDGKPDYLLFNPTTRQTLIWYLNNNVYMSSAYGPTIPAGWTPVAVADFNGDGKPDLVLFNSGTNQTAIWYLNNNVFVSGNYGPTLPAGFLLISAAGDFNHDGKPDFLLYNPTTHRSAIWYLNGRTLLAGVYGPTVPASYTLDDLADFNHDGRPDYLLNYDRVTALWYLNGNILLGSAYGPTIAQGWSAACTSSKPCIFSIAPHAASYSSAGGGGNIYVSTLQFGCTWTTTTTSPWIHITHGSSYVGSGYASYTVDPYYGTMTQVGYITIAGTPFQITQSGMNSACSIAGTWAGTVSGTFHSYNGGCPWTGTTSFSMVITQNGTTISGSGNWNGAPCWDISTCGILDFAETSGTVTGSTANCPTVSFDYSGTYMTGNCSGQGTSGTYTLTLNGNTLSGTTSSGHTVSLTRQP